MLEIDPNFIIPDSELEWTFVRSSGPGGQNVNKVASKAVLRWDAKRSGRLDQKTFERMSSLYPGRVTKEGEVVITSQRTRDALKNRNDCLEKLRSMILKSLERPKPRIKTKPTRGSIERRLDAKKRQARKKENRKFGGGEG